MAQEKMTLEDWLDDLCVRFIINLPREDLSSVARICFQIEEAQWFYEDFIRPLDPNLPSMSLRSFSLKMFQHCPLLASFSTESHLKAFEEFMQYKTRVPVRGAIMLNDEMDAVVLVRGYKKGASWSFPRGKINKDEDDLDCAVREVYEETGYDLKEAGLVEKNYPVHPLEVTMHAQQVRLYVFRGVPDDTVFETKTRKEIGDIKWYKVSDLPAYRKKKVAGRNNGSDGPSHEKFYMVAPFMVQLRQWVLKQKKLDAKNAVSSSSHHHPPAFYDDNVTDDNVVDEPGQVPPESMDSTTKELQRLLKANPPTQGLQIPSPTSNQQAGQALLSLLQSKTINNGHTHEQSQAVPHTPLDHTSEEAPQPLTPHRRHPTQRIPTSAYGVPPSFPIDPNLDVGHSHQYRPRPRVHIDSSDTINQATLTNPPRQFQHQPVQLLHPQPLPPQVQKTMLLRGMASSPQATDPSVQSTMTGPSQGHYRIAQGPQHQVHGTQASQPERQLPSQLPAHSASLLNVLKGTAAQTSTNQHARPQSPQHAISSSATDQPQQRQFPGSNAGFASQYGANAMSSSFGTLTTNSTQVASSSADVQPIRPTDKHRAGLLDMFKKVESSIHQNQVRRESLDGARPHSGRSMERQKSGGQSPSGAGSFRTGTQDYGRPMQMNPETNLPFRALGILSRPQAGQPSNNPTNGSGRNSIDAAQNAPQGSYAGSSLRNESPTTRKYRQRTQQSEQSSPQARPSSMQSYPYGTGQGSAPNPLSLFPNPPTTSTLPNPSAMKPRQNSSAEQRNALLSLFGKPQSQSKGKEPEKAEQFVSSAVPRSRLASFASSAGEGTGGLRGNTSRRSSHAPAPLSPEDRSFLLGFLENASNSSKR
ncbi:hypothetical protein F4779DRAFT_560207 [Xylariaceae sp. FL0662B]|nr:hypothetical protein F4779DRAFT_560207 [Xylariaceae sp. FL0662B]